MDRQDISRGVLFVDLCLFVSIRVCLFVCLRNEARVTANWKWRYIKPVLKLTFFFSSFFFFQGLASYWFGVTRRDKKKRVARNLWILEGGQKTPHQWWAKKTSIFPSLFLRLSFCIYWLITLKYVLVKL